MREATLAIIKPDVVKDSHIGMVLNVVEMMDLRIDDLKTVSLDRSAMGDFYKEHEGKSFFKGLINFMSSGPIVVAVLSGEDAIKRWRFLMGPTDPKEARVVAPDSIRAVHGTELPANAVHGSDSAGSAKREIEFFFGSQGARE